MPDLNDFHAFTSTAGGGGSGSTGGGGGAGGCGCFTWGIVIVCVLWVIGKLAGWRTTFREFSLNPAP